MPLILTQIVVRLLYTQPSDGSWGQSCSCETTAYSILALRATSSLPWLTNVITEVGAALERATRYLEYSIEKWKGGEYIWIEKVTYRSATLSQAYCLAAIKDSSLYAWGDRRHKLTSIWAQQLHKYSTFFGSLPIFSTQSSWKIRLSLLESHMFLPKLKSIRLDVFSRTNMAKDEYLSYIPFTWVGINNLHGSILNNALLWEMMVLSMLNYQANEYMKTAIVEQFGQNCDVAQALVDRLCADLVCSEPAELSCQLHRLSSDSDSDASSLRTPESLASPPPGTSTPTIERVLAAYIHHITAHPAVLVTLPSAQRQLRRELLTFIHAHLTQNSHNAALTSTPQRLPSDSFFAWARSMSADHTSCPFSFEFYSALNAQPGVDLYRGARVKYLTTDVARHLATLCRQYNNAGSVAHDWAEGNLNSMDFAEFHDENGHGDGRGDEEGRKRVLMGIAAYERECLELAWRHLKTEVKVGTMEVLRIFVDVTDLYGKIYLARDIARRMKKGPEGESSKG